MAAHSWDHDQWEIWGLALVRRCYGHDQVIEVPDAAGGDHGIEAFTRDGIAFQCYSSENEPLPPSRRGALQKKKIGADIATFIDGGAALKAILGTTTIHTWILLTPYHEDAAVIPYCNAKAAEVEAAGLDYVQSPFCVDVHSLKTYSSEHASLLEEAMLTDDLTRAPDEHVTAAEFADVWSELIEIMDQKLAKLEDQNDPAARGRLRSALLVEQVHGAGLLDRWRDRVPDVATHLDHVIGSAKNQLVIESVSASIPSEHFQAVRSDVRERIKTIGGLSDANVRHIADMAITDWLQSCDLDFFEVDS